MTGWKGETGGTSPARPGPCRPASSRRRREAADLASIERMARPDRAPRSFYFYSAINVYNTKVAKNKGKISRVVAHVLYCYCTNF